MAHSITAAASSKSVPCTDLDVQNAISTNFVTGVMSCGDFSMFSTFHDEIADVLACCSRMKIQLQFKSKSANYLCVSL